MDYLVLIIVAVVVNRAVVVVIDVEIDVAATMAAAIDAAATTAVAIDAVATVVVVVADVVVVTMIVTLMMITILIVAAVITGVQDVNFVTIRRGCLGNLFFSNQNTHIAQFIISPKLERTYSIFHRHKQFIKFFI